MVLKQKEEENKARLIQLNQSRCAAYGQELEKEFFQGKICKFQKSFQGYNPEREILEKSEAIQWQAQAEFAQLELAEAQQQLREHRKYAGLYRQLREQFKQKADLVHELRQENFSFETKALVKDLEDCQKDWEEHKKYEDSLLGVTTALIEENSEKDEEIGNLQGIIKVLLLAS